MKYLKLFENFKPKSEFIVSKLELSPDDKEGFVFATIDWSTEKRILEMEDYYFLSYIQKENENLKSYINGLKGESPEMILGDLQEIGVSLKPIMQKYVDENITQEKFDKLNHDSSQVSDIDMRSAFGLDDEYGDVGLLDPTNEGWKSWVAGALLLLSSCDSVKLKTKDGAETPYPNLQTIGTIKELTRVPMKNATEYYITIIDTNGNEINIEKYAMNPLPDDETPSLWLLSDLEEGAKVKVICKDEDCKVYLLDKK